MTCPAPRHSRPRPPSLRRRPQSRPTPRPHLRHSRESGNPHPLFIAPRWRGGQGVRPAPHPAHPCILKILMQTKTYPGPDPPPPLHMVERGPGGEARPPCPPHPLAQKSRIRDSIECNDGRKWRVRAAHRGGPGAAARRDAPGNRCLSAGPFRRPLAGPPALHTRWQRPGIGGATTRRVGLRRRQPRRARPLRRGARGRGRIRHDCLGTRATVVQRQGRPVWTVVSGLDPVRRRRSSARPA